MSATDLFLPPEISGLVNHKPQSLALVGHETEAHALIWQHIHENEWYLQFIFVMPAARGQGLASLMLHLICAAADEQQKVIRLGVTAVGYGGLGNKALRAWYRRHGFKRTAACEAGQLIRYPQTP